MKMVLVSVFYAIALSFTTSHAADEKLFTIVAGTPIQVLSEKENKVSEEDKRLIALVTMGEAEGESEMGKRLVIDTILNRVDHSLFPNTVREVIYAPKQFSCMWNGRSKWCYVQDSILRLVEEELQQRTNSDCLYFRAGHYGIGTAMFQEGNHYFSGL